MDWLRKAFIIAITAMILTVLATESKAGKYVVTYSGGTFTQIVSDMPPITRAYSLDSSGNYSAGGGTSWPVRIINGVKVATSGSAVCDGEIIATFTWQSSGVNDDPPSKLIIREECRVAWNTGGGKLGAGSCQNGLGTSVDHLIDTPVSQSYVADGVRYQVKDNPGLGFSIRSTVAADGTPIANGIPKANVAGQGSLNPDTGGGGAVSITYKAEPQMRFVSGTDCLYTFRTPFKFAGTLSNITITVKGGSVSASLFNGASIGSGTSMSPKGVTYCSTKFPDLTVIKFKTVATNTTGKSFTDEDWYVAYNKYSVSFKTDLPDSISELIPSDFRIMNHVGILPGADQNTNAWIYDKNNFKEACREATGIHFNLHGTPTTLQPFANVNTGIITSAEIAAETAKRYWRPQANVIYAASCSTCAGGSTVMANAFGVASNATDRAYVGFDAISGGEARVAEKFWDVLVTGEIVQEARDQAQGEYIRLGLNNYYPANLVIVGGPNTTLYATPFGFPLGTPWFKVK